ncbi:hypothetical protein Tco_0660743 [Tanacetum coccineum]
MVRIPRCGRRGCTLCLEQCQIGLVGRSSCDERRADGVPFADGLSLVLLQSFCPGDFVGKRATYWKSCGCRWLFPKPSLNSTSFQVRHRRRGEGESVTS